MFSPNTIPEICHNGNNTKSKLFEQILAVGITNTTDDIKTKCDNAIFNKQVLNHLVKETTTEQIAKSILESVLNHYTLYLNYTKKSELYNFCSEQIYFDSLDELICLANTKYLFLVYLHDLLIKLKLKTVVNVTTDIYASLDEYTYTKQLQIGYIDEIVQPYSVHVSDYKMQMFTLVELVMFCLISQCE